MGHWIVPLEPLQAAPMRLDFFVAGGESPLRINTRKQYEREVNPIARKGQGRNSLAGCRDSVPAGVKGQRPLRQLFFAHGGGIGKNSTMNAMKARKMA